MSLAANQKKKKTAKRNSKTHLQQRMPSNDTQKAFKTLSSALDHLIRKPVGEHFPRECGDVDSGRLVLEDVPECFKVGVAPTDKGVPEFESRYVGLRVCGQPDKEFGR